MAIKYHDLHSQKLQMHPKKAAAVNLLCPNSVLKHPEQSVVTRNQTVCLIVIKLQQICKKLIDHKQPAPRPGKTKIGRKFANSMLF